MKDEEVILRKCVAEEDILDAAFEAPYDAVDGWVYGCDRRMFVRIKKEECEGTYPEHWKGSVIQAMVGAPSDLYLPLSELADALAKCPIVDEEKEAGEDVECDECGGDGTVYVDYWSDKRKRYFDLPCECPVCSGTGYVESVKTVKTGRRVLDPMAVVSIDGVGFKAVYLAVLKDLAGMMGAGSLHIVNFGKARAMVVQLSESVQFGVMPNTLPEVVSKMETRRAKA